jgi:hypothetical protein
MTKFTKEMKAERKMLKAIFSNVSLHSFPEYGITVGIERTGESMGRFAVAIAAADEPRFRRKVGEFYVLQRFDASQTLPLVLHFHDEVNEDIARNIAEAIA